ncbi:VPLPA-CTERM sorting domain-containing protein [Sulfurirhabdus autotrophica]|uniref:Putative secreted protein n=1 Tax=Sulfurirhabdus autotrophica TaxID=1706046 RepID=A0A4R3XWP6_9PROT|nr:VPLPA-CTERM sorting domain-containing protein [Sulfurirhabdus autotrophica]TCV83397.1 putative secreted protein [Sulfurirhabdus autotrophica]
MISMKKTVLGAALAIAFSAGAAQAAYTPIVTTTGNNFTMVSASNGLTGGTNDVTFSWDGTFKTSVVTDGSYNATLSSPTAFSGKKWTAHNVNIYGAGTYTFDTGCATGNPSCGTGPSYTMTVGAGQVGAHMLFDWSTSANIDVVVLWDMNNSWAGTGTTSAFCAGTGANCAGVGNSVTTIWNGVSIDTNMDPDNYSGTKMIDGPFVGQSANFNINGIHAQPSAVPVPAAAWLLGSGLVGLVSVARRRKVVA